MPEILWPPTPADPRPLDPPVGYGNCSKCGRALCWEEWETDEEGRCYGCYWQDHAPPPCPCGDKCCFVPGGCGYVLVDGELKRKEETQ